MAIKKPENYESWLHDNGRLRKSLPTDLFPIKSNNGANEDIQEFILVISVIFNDLKGLLISHDTMVEVYEHSEPKERNSHRGEYAGIKMQLQTLIFGKLHETFEYLENSRDIYESEKIQSLLGGTSKKVKVTWDALYRLAIREQITDQRFSDLSDILPTLEKIRHNVAFHYQMKKQLRNGYRKFFYEGLSFVSAGDREYAYRSSESDALKSRYFYADAALQGYLYNAFGGEQEYKEAEEKIITLLGMILNAFNGMLIEYHATLPQR